MADLVINTGNLMTAPPTGRVQRTPKHTFYTETRPYTITPFVIAPVLAAETLSSVWMEVRQVTQPIKNPMLGWTSEFYVFYVMLSDLNNRAIFETMLLDPTASVTNAMDEAADVRYYHRVGQPNYAKQCLRRVVETYFRDTDEAWDVATIDQYPVAQIKDHGWMDSLTDATLLGGGADPSAATDMQDLDKMYSAYEYLRAMQLTDMTFEQYIGTFGVRLTVAEVHKPELIAHWRDFTYPSNTIDPLSGNPSSACSWAFKESNRKPIFFREPGFIFGVQVQRPKLYLAREYSHLVDFLDNGLLWLPAILSDRPERRFASSRVPVQAMALCRMVRRGQRMATGSICEICSFMATSSLILLLLILAIKQTASRCRMQRSIVSTFRRVMRIISLLRPRRTSRGLMA